MAADQRLNPAEGHRTRPRPRTRAAAHWARHGTVLPGHGSEVAAYRSRLTAWHEQQEVQARG